MAVFRLNNEIIFLGIIQERKYYGGALNQGLLFTQVKLKYQIP